MTVFRCINCNKILAEGDFNGSVTIHCHNNKCKVVNKFCCQNLSFETVDKPDKSCYYEDKEITLL